MSGKATGNLRGLAFVGFSSQGAASRAVEKFLGTELQGRQLAVNIANPHKQFAVGPRSDGGLESHGNRRRRQPRAANKSLTSRRRAPSLDRNQNYG